MLVWSGWKLKSSLGIVNFIALSKLDNDNFVKRAPKEIVSHEKQKYNNYKNDYDKLVDNLNSLSFWCLLNSSNYTLELKTDIKLITTLITIL